MARYLVIAMDKRSFPCYNFSIIYVLVGKNMPADQGGYIMKNLNKYMTLLNGETAIYRSITAEEIAEFIRHNLGRNQSATLIYRSKP